MLLMEFRYSLFDLLDQHLAPHQMSLVSRPNSIIYINFKGADRSAQLEQLQLVHYLELGGWKVMLLMEFRCRPYDLLVQHLPQHQMSLVAHQNSIIYINFKGADRIEQVV